MLSGIKEAARRAILQIAPAGVQDTIYTDIRQGPTEPFSSFTDRLTQAVVQQVTDKGARPHLIKSLAFANANLDCRRVISAMPNTQPSLAEMVEVCSKVGTPQHVASIVKQDLQGQLEQHLEGQMDEWMDRMFQAQNESIDKKNSLPAGQCYKCGAFGHFKRNCPQMPRTEKPSDLCPRCRRGRHLASECRSQTDVD